MTPRAAVWLLYTLCGVCVCVHACVCIGWVKASDPESTKSRSLKCQDPDTQNTQIKMYMCGLKKHENPTCKYIKTRNSCVKINTEVHASKHALFMPRPKSLWFRVSHKASRLKTTRLAPPVHLPWKDFFRHNLSPGSFSYLTVVHVVWRGWDIYDTGLHHRCWRVFFWYNY